MGQLLGYQHNSPEGLTLQHHLMHRGCLLKREGRYRRSNDVPLRQLDHRLQVVPRASRRAKQSGVAEEDRDSVLNGLRDVIERRVNLFGVAEPQVFLAQSAGETRLIVETRPPQTSETP